MYPRVTVSNEVCTFSVCAAVFSLTSAVDVQQTAVAYVCVWSNSSVIKYWDQLNLSGTLLTLTSSSFFSLKWERGYTGMCTGDVLILVFTPSREETDIGVRCVQSDEPSGHRSHREEYKHFLNAYLMSQRLRSTLYVQKTRWHHMCVVRRHLCVRHRIICFSP